jgi:predicted DNA-binding protein YlxM (UPF0122 family)
MNDLFEISMLLDFYGQLITKRQYEIMDLHYNSDYSFGEIAGFLNISRQGVYDNIKRGKALLTDFEQKLGLVGRFIRQRERALEIQKQLERIEASRLETRDVECLNAAKKAVLEIMED